MSFPTTKDTMNNIKKNLAIYALAVGAGLPVSSFAQAAIDHSKAGMPQVEAAMADGEVRKVDQDTGKVTIKHGEIKHLDMPGMTMVFTAKDKSLLAGVKPGDKIKFMVVSEGGKMVVTEIQQAR